MEKKVGMQGNERDENEKVIDKNQKPRISREDTKEAKWVRFRLKQSINNLLSKSDDCALKTTIYLRYKPQWLLGNQTNTYFYFIRLKLPIMIYASMGG